MIRRIFVTALGGLAGLAIALGLPIALGWTYKSFWNDWRGDLLFVVAFASLALAVGEKLRIVPSQEKVDKELRPISLFPTYNQDRQPDIPNGTTHVSDIAAEQRER